jgi:ketosteroid isomerase-like protein
MKSHIARLLCVLLLFSAVAFAQKEKDKPVTKKRDGRAATKVREAKTPVPDKALMQKVCDAWTTMNPSNAAKYYAKDAGLAFYDVAPVKYTGWAQYEAGAKEMMATLQSIKFTVNDDAKVYSHPQGALGTATINTEFVQKSGAKLPLELRWTVVWEKRGPEWLIVHEHVSAPMKE